MKKMLAPMLVVVALLLGITSDHVTYAKDVYACTYNNYDFYVDDQSVIGWPEQFSCKVAQKNKKTGKIERFTCGFVVGNGRIIGNAGNGNVVVSPQKPAYWGVYKTARPYLKSIF